MGWKNITPEQAQSMEYYAEKNGGIWSDKFVSILFVFYASIIIQLSDILFSSIYFLYNNYNKSDVFVFFTIQVLRCLVFAPFLIMALRRHRGTPIAGIIGVWAFVIVSAAWPAWRVDLFGIGFLTILYTAFAVIFTWFLLVSKQVNVSYRLRIKE